jgi:hypothetical protein
VSRWLQRCAEAHLVACTAPPPCTCRVVLCCIMSRLHQGTRGVLGIIVTVMLSSNRVRICQPGPCM